VLTANSAPQGLQIAAASVIAAVIVDYHMAEMNGQEIATEIKRFTPQVPIVMLSSDQEIPEHALNVVDAFVSKNDAPSRLFPMIIRMCDENSSGFQGTGTTAGEYTGLLRFLRVLMFTCPRYPHDSRN
jgi:CheY-like chemotaxis protein